MVQNVFFFVNNKPKIERIKERTTRQRNKKIYRLDIIQDVKKEKVPLLLNSTKRGTEHPVGSTLT